MALTLTPEQIDRLIQQADGLAPKEGSIFRALVKLTEAEVRKAVIEASGGVQALSAASPPAEQQAAPKAAPAQQAGEAAESVPAVEREQERIAFKDAHRHLELYEVPDAWGRPMFKHSHVEASWLGWIARASRGQASSQAGEYPALVCDYCGALTPDPWHSSGMLHGKMSKHIHSCDACAARGVAKAQDTPAYSPSQSDL